jgi:hypothetical protein
MQWKLKSPFTPTSLAFFIPVLLFAGTIVWDKYKTKVGLEVRLVSTSSILNDSPSVEHLQVLYGGKPVPNLAKSEFVIVNIGRTPIQQSDLVSPPTITVLNSVQLFDVRKETPDPSNLQFALTADTADRSFTLTSPLLNPGDQIRVNTITSGPVTRFDASARIVGISHLKVTAQTLPTSKQRQENSQLLLLVVVFLFSLTAFSLYTLGRESAVKVLFESGFAPVPDHGLSEVYEKYLSALLRASGKYVGDAHKLLQDAPSAGGWHASQQEKFVGAIGASLQKVRITRLITIIASLLSVASLLYAMTLLSG